MIMNSPKVDERTSEEVALQVRALLSRTAGGHLAGEGTGQASDALIHIFGHLCGIIIDRLNRAPDKHLLAFLDLVGISPSPARAARVPVTFYLAEQFAGHVTVPAGTQIAAAPEKGEQDPVIFETERTLVVTSARLVALMAKDGVADRFGDHSSILTKAKPEGVSPFNGDTLVEHAIFLDVPLPQPAPSLHRLAIRVDVEPLAKPAHDWISWEIWQGPASAPLPLIPTLDETAQLTRTGNIVFEEVPPIPSCEVNGRLGHWLRCRATATISKESIPTFRSIHINHEAIGTGLPVDLATVNGVTVDPSKDYAPFGERPRFGDSFYLANSDAFSKPGSLITIHVVLTNPESAGANSAIPATVGRAVRLRWEMWDGSEWSELGTVESGREIRNEATAFSDTTKAFTESGTITLRVPDRISPVAHSGQQAFWLRVRIAGGDYGHDMQYQRGGDGVYTIVPATYAPPFIKSIRVDYKLETTVQVSTLVALNEWTYKDVDARGGGFSPFQPVNEPEKLLYFGFDCQDGSGGRSMSIYVSPAPLDNPSAANDAGNQPPAIWEYWNGVTWSKWTVIDDTSGFRRAGLIRFLAPADFVASRHFGKELYWLRVYAEPDFDPKVRVVLLNTTMASHSITMPSEILGSSIATPSQTFKTARFPILEGQTLEVLEPAKPIPSVRQAITEEEGEQAMRPARTGDPRGGELWVRWHEVPNFAGSAPWNSHYVLDRESGEVTFGDGVKGRIPPALPRNIVMARYQTGGGQVGNRMPHRIEQLKSAIPYVAKVTNPEAAGGGADAEAIAKVIQRAPRQLRHGFRAVTPKDFEDLALAASPEVARARCVPLYDLARDPDCQHPRPGTVSLIIAPVAERSAATQGWATARPMPTLELFGRVRDYLDERRPLEADLILVGPEYVMFEVEAEVAVTDIDHASEIELAVNLAISRFLHPLSGRKDLTGWRFGQEPAKSDLYALIEAVPGVGHIRQLKMNVQESVAGAHKRRRFLVSGAPPKVVTTLEE